MLPTARLLPLKVNVPTDFVPEAARVADPNVVPPSLKVTVPVGATVPLAGVTVALNTVAAPAAILAGAADITVVVAAGGAATVIIKGADVEGRYPGAPT